MNPLARSHSPEAPNGTPQAAGLESDDESQVWIDGLRSRGAVRAAAIDALHALLLNAARFEVRRRIGALPRLSASEGDRLAAQSADDALVAVICRLGEFGGDRRFTTWASKFALAETAREVRRLTSSRRETATEGEYRTSARSDLARQSGLMKKLSAALEEDGG